MLAVFSTIGLEYNLQALEGSCKSLVALVWVFRCISQHHGLGSIMMVFVTTPLFDGKVRYMD